jgi:hypothetical protein
VPTDRMRDRLKSIGLISETRDGLAITDEGCAASRRANETYDPRRRRVNSTPIRNAAAKACSGACRVQRLRLSNGMPGC